MRVAYTVIAVAGALLVASPSVAGGGAGPCPMSGSGCGGGTPVPEPSDFALFAGGVAALLIGRRAGKRRNTGAADKE